MLSAKRIDEVIKNCQALIQQKSYSGQEGEVVNAVSKMMQHYQFDDIHVDKYGNIVGGIVGNQPGQTLVLDGHIDTVPVNERSGAATRTAAISTMAKFMVAVQPI